MKVSQEVIAKYGTNVADCVAFDVDANVLLQFFEAPEKGNVLCVGTHDEAVANILQESGFNVIGVDLREYDSNLPACNYDYIRRDFCEMNKLDFYERIGGAFEGFDAFVSLSAIEHFGYGTYEEGQLHKYYDVIALRKAWEVLRIGGVAYITVPFGKNFVECIPHWRIYDDVAIGERLVQDFTLEGVALFCSAPAVINGVTRPTGTIITPEEAKGYDDPTPHVTIFLILRKDRVSRLAPDGR